MEVCDATSCRNCVLREFRLQLPYNAEVDVCGKAIDLSQQNSLASTVMLEARTVIYRITIGEHLLDAVSYASHEALLLFLDGNMLSLAKGGNWVCWQIFCGDSLTRK